MGQNYKDLTNIYLNKFIDSEDLDYFRFYQKSFYSVFCYLLYIDVEYLPIKMIKD